MSDDPESAISDNLSDKANFGSSDIRHIRHVFVGALSYLFYEINKFLDPHIPKFIS